METIGKKKITCIECGDDKVANPTNFYKSVSKEFEVYNGFNNTCKKCFKDMCYHPKSGVLSKEGVIKALKRLDKPFKNDIFEKFEVDSFNIGTYLKNLNLKYKNVRFDDSDIKDTVTAKTAVVNSNSEQKSELKDSYEDINFEEDGSRKVSYDREWRGSYTPDELYYLNDYYKKLHGDYKIVTTNHKDYARKIAKASLAMDNEFNLSMQGVMGADKKYTDLQKVFDNLCKSAQFSANTKGANDVGVSSFSQIFEIVENHQWVETYVPLSKDEYDKMLEAFSSINKSV